MKTIKKYIKLLLKLYIFIFDLLLSQTKFHDIVFVNNKEMIKTKLLCISNEIIV